MPYNNTPIAPSKEITGTVALPLARVKKIINTDPDVGSCSNNAAFVITVATEMFLQHLVEQAHNQVKSEQAQKPRRNIQYRDVANAVARVENLEFLSDVVPRTMTYKQFKQKTKESAAQVAGSSTELAHGQGTLDGHLGQVRPKKEDSMSTMEVDQQADYDDADDDDDDEGLPVKLKKKSDDEDLPVKLKKKSDDEALPVKLKKKNEDSDSEMEDS